MPVYNSFYNNKNANQTAHQLVNCLRFLAIDGVQKANSGHPGMPMGMADVAYVLYAKFLKFNPQDPLWSDRDRFVLSAGHGSMLLYALNYLTGYEGMSLDELKKFRQFGSHTAGHPEVNQKLGIETTTGPLGQGIATAVGMAMAEKLLQAQLSSDLINHKVYTIVGDGCLSEGLSQEAISFAGHLCLNNLVVLWDDNQITIDGATDLSTSEDQLMRFRAAGWYVQPIDGHDHEQIALALQNAQHSAKPSLIACKTIIGFGSPNKNSSASCHGSPLGIEEIELTRQALDWPHAAFEIPTELLMQWREIGTRSKEHYSQWQAKFSALSEVEQQAFLQRIDGSVTGNVAQEVLRMVQAECVNGCADATRIWSQKVLEVLAQHLPQLLGGSADLTGSNNTKANTMQAVSKDNFCGNYVHYGVREHAMAAIMNGVALHGGFIPYGGTFLVFTDYARPAIRLSALMRQRVIYVMTHDSIGLGEDGPTHQPIEHLSSLRAVPNLYVFRPADLTETAESWLLSMGIKGPSVLSLTRQKIPMIRCMDGNNLTAMGGYIVNPQVENPQVTLIASGSEVHIALQAQELLQQQQISVNVVSMPCQELFDMQPRQYQQQVLGQGLRVAIEAAHPMSWYKYVGLEGLVIGIETFGESAPYQELYQHFGLTAQAITDKVTAQLGNI